MPRPKTITWEKRVAIFLAYRRNGGKVNPVSKSYGIARSTVNVIVKEFTDMGFSNRPRARVSAEFLQQMQERHFAEVARQLHSPHEGDAQYRVVSGILDRRVRVTEEDAHYASKIDPMPLATDLAWHIRGTAADRTLSQARSAAQDLHRRVCELRAEMRSSVEIACNLEVETCPDPNKPNPTPHIFPELLRLLQRAFFEQRFASQAPPPDWPDWATPPNDPMLLQAQNENLAHGSREDHQKVRLGIRSWVENRFKEFQRWERELEQLSFDLRYMDEIVQRNLQAVGNDDVRRGICPGCPYPEAREESEGAEKQIKHIGRR